VALGDITREAVLAAVAEYDELGQDQFLSTYGFQSARPYVLIHARKSYDSKAIVGAAHGFLPGQKPLTAGQFTGGVTSVGRLLRRLNFPFQVGETLTPGILADLLARLQVNRSGGPPALYQPITLLWAIGRARSGEPRTSSWSQTQREVATLLARYGRPGEREAVHFPVAALYGAGLWELDAEPRSVPSAHGSHVQRWFNDHQPNGGLVEPVYALVRESPEARAAAVGKLIDERYFTGADATNLLAEIGLSEHVGTGSVTADGRPQGSTAGDWTEAENRAIVDGYLAMLALECAGQPYSKTDHRNALIESIGGTRSPGSIERKHQNISAVMLQLGLPYIKGYKPLPNIQQALLTEVKRRLEADPAWVAELQPQSESPAEVRFSASLRRVAVPDMPTEPRGRKVDYGLLQEESKRVGDRGEEFVFNFEKASLEREGRADLAMDVLWVAREVGDGAGYDIRSFGLDGRPLYIEVKATKLGALTPFYITSAELDFARRHQGEYAIYRVFDVDGDAPEFYILEGDLDTLLIVEPVTYRARPHSRRDLGWKAWRLSQLRTHHPATSAHSAHSPPGPTLTGSRT
jgi:hypothetical protein